MAESDYSMKLDRGLWVELTKVLEQLPQTVENQVVGGAAKKALDPVYRVARGILGARSGTTGTLGHSLGIVQKRNKRRGTVYTIVGPRTGYKNPETGENPVNIAHLVEFGTDPHLIAPKGAAGALKIKRGVGPTVIVEGAVHHPGAQAKPFMRPAYDAKGREVLSTMEAELEKGILRRVARFEKKGKL